MSELFLSVVVPCYNESENLRAGVLQEMAAYLGRQPYDYEVWIVGIGFRYLIGEH